MQSRPGFKVQTLGTGKHQAAAAEAARKPKAGRWPRRVSVEAGAVAGLLCLVPYLMRTRARGS